MTKISLGQAIGLIANIAVIAGIVFLAIETHQNTEMMAALMTQSRAEASMAEAQAMFNSDYIPELLVKVRTNQDLTAVDKERFSHWFREFNRNQDNQLRQYNQGFLPENVLRSVRLAVRNEIASSPIGRQMWEDTKLNYTDEYITLVDAILSESNPENSGASETAR